MAKKEMMSEAAWELCNTAKVDEDKRNYFYDQNDAGDWVFVWESSVTQPFTLSQLEAKADELWAAEALTKVRRMRDNLLTQSDWTQGADVPDAIKTAWTSYRKKLRDMPADNPDAKLSADGVLSDVTWPTKP
jgi:hypothetical protein